MKNQSRLICILSLLALVSGCTEAAHDGHSGQTSPGNISKAIVGVWRTECDALPDGSSRQSELNFTSAGELKPRSLVYTDNACKSINQQSTDDGNKSVLARSFKADPATRGRGAKGTLTITIHGGAADGKDKVESYEAAIINNVFGLQLRLRRTGSDEEGEFYTRISEPPAQVAVQ